MTSGEISVPGTYESSAKIDELVIVASCSSAVFVAGKLFNELVYTEHTVDNYYT